MNGKDYKVKVKICGITNKNDAMAAVDAGADAIGFIFYKESPRFIIPEKAKEIIDCLPPFITTVGVFVNESVVAINDVKYFTGIDIIQLHGDEPPMMCNLWQRLIKAFRVRDFVDLTMLEQYKCSNYLLDTYTHDNYGGTGQIFNWDIAVEAKRYGRIILSGGLTPENIDKAVRYVQPYGVDVNSGVESSKKGVKDVSRLRAFIERAKSSVIQP